MQTGDCARVRFPAGLVQPVGSYRFGLDALLLACHAAREIEGISARESASRAVELGCGCGASILALALLKNQLQCLGIELEDALAEAARANALLMGCHGRVKIAHMDIADIKTLADHGQCQSQYDLALANPPWRKPCQGRAPASILRRAALCGEEGILDVFCKNAAALLRHHGIFAAIVPPDLITDLCGACGRARLGLKRILPVAPFAGQPAKRLLVSAQKNACSNPRIFFPLVLHERDRLENRPAWTREARDFCPWLNPKAACGANI